MLKPFPDLGGSGSPDPLFPVRNPMLDAPDLLERAAKTMRERSAERDTQKERAMARTIAMFNAQFGTNLTEYQGWMFMLNLKLARAEGGSFREDDYLDAAAYAALAGECRGKETVKNRFNATEQGPIDGRSDVSVSGDLIIRGVIHK